jgi:acetylornithine/succinyldiaminopimelate/putrescine aminotransferase
LAVTFSVQDVVGADSQIDRLADELFIAGLGTSLFIDTPKEGDQAFKLQQHLLKEGVLTKLNGSRGIALKPALILEQRHLDQLTAALSRY